jgi:hypothetical protein
MNNLLNRTAMTRFILKTRHAIGCGFPAIVTGLSVLFATCQSVSAFSFWGPKEAYQVDNLGYRRFDTTEYQGVIWFTYAPDFSYAPHKKSFAGMFRIYFMRMILRSSIISDSTEYVR